MSSITQNSYSTQTTVQNNEKITLSAMQKTSMCDNIRNGKIKVSSAIIESKLKPRSVFRILKMHKNGQEIHGRGGRPDRFDSISLEKLKLFNQDNPNCDAITINAQIRTAANETDVRRGSVKNFKKVVCAKSLQKIKKIIGWSKTSL